MSSYSALIKPIVCLATAFILACSTPTLANDTTYASTFNREHSRMCREGIRQCIYDTSIKKWNSYYTPEIPWYWNKAQIKAESAFNPIAVSPVGARGLGQFMPLTWKQVVKEIGLAADANVNNATVNIQAQAYYMHKLRSQFKAKRPEYDKHSLALASYNAGLGNILKAQKKANNSLLWKPTALALPSITGHHSKETTDYVSRIWEYIKHYEDNAY